MAESLILVLLKTNHRIYESKWRFWTFTPEKFVIIYQNKHSSDLADFFDPRTAQVKTFVPSNKFEVWSFLCTLPR